MKSYPIQLCGDYFINHEIGMPIQQPGFYGKYPVGLFSWLDLDQKSRRGRFVRTKKSDFFGLGKVFLRNLCRLDFRQMRDTKQNSKSDM